MTINFLFSERYSLIYAAECAHQLNNARYRVMKICLHTCCSDETISFNKMKLLLIFAFFLALSANMNLTSNYCSFLWVCLWTSYCNSHTLIL